MTSCLQLDVGCRIVRGEFVRKASNSKMVSIPPECPQAVQTFTVCCRCWRPTGASSWPEHWRARSSWRYGPEAQEDARLCGFGPLLLLVVLPLAAPGAACVALRWPRRRGVAHLHPRPRPRLEEPPPERHGLSHRSDSNPSIFPAEEKAGQHTIKLPVVAR